MTQILLCVADLMVFGLGLVVWRARPEAPANRWFGAFMLFSAIWILGVSLFYAEANPVFWAMTAFAGSSLVPAAFLSFVRYYPTPTKWLRPWVLGLNFGIGLFFAGASMTTRLIVK